MKVEIDIPEKMVELTKSKGVPEELLEVFFQTYLNDIISPFMHDGYYFIEEWFESDDCSDWFTEHNLKKT